MIEQLQLLPEVLIRPQSRRLDVLPDERSAHRQQATHGHDLISERVLGLRTKHLHSVQLIPLLQVMPSGDDVPPPVLTHNSENHAPVPLVSVDPEDGAPVHAPHVEIHPLPIKNLQQPLRLRHVVVWDRRPRRARLRAALVVGALDLQNTALGVSSRNAAVDEAIRRRAQPPVQVVTLLVNLERDVVHEVAREFLVPIDGAGFLVRPPDGRGVPRERLAQAQLLLPKLSPPRLPKPQRVPERARGDAALPQAVPELRPLLQIRWKRKRRGLIVPWTPNI